MKIKSKNASTLTLFVASLMLTLLIVSLVSCKQRVPKEVIESYKADNAFYERDLNEKNISKEELLKEEGDNYKQFLTGVDPKKITAFEKDKALQEEIHNKRSCLIELADKNQATQDSIIASIAANNLFIESLHNIQLKKEDADEQWTEYKVRISKFRSGADSLANEITNNKSQVYELYKKSLLKYGTQPKAPKKNKKK